MKNFVDMYVQIIDKLLLDVINHDCVITPTAYAIWGTVPMCSVNADLDLVIAENVVVIKPTDDEYCVEITVTTSQNSSASAKYYWEQDEVENLIYTLAAEWSDDYCKDDVVAEMRAELATQTTALASEIVEIIDRFFKEN